MNSTWTKPSRSFANGNCVEVRADPAGTVAVRDSKDRSGPVLSFSREQWDAFLAAIRDGYLTGP
jgi:hypothetical protein